MAEEKQNWKKREKESRHILTAEICIYLQEKHPDFQILELNFFEEWLSKVRNQRKTKSCAFIAGVSCIEMNCKKLKKEAAGTTKYFLDVQDVFENLHKVYQDEAKSKEKRDDGISMDEVFQYAVDLGLVVTNRCRNPVMKNLYSHCCACPPRQKIVSFAWMEVEEAFKFASHTPIVAAIDHSYDSFGECEQVIYMGPSETEIAAGEYDGHAVVVVGNARIRIGHEVTNFFVLQNSYGTGFGCGGYVLIPTHLVDDFWVPVVTDQQLSLRKLKKLCRESSYARESTKEAGEGSSHNLG